MQQTKIHSISQKKNAVPLGVIERSGPRIILTTECKKFQTSDCYFDDIKSTDKSCLKLKNI